MNSPILEVKNISKTFGNIKALDQVNFLLEKGVIHGLLARMVQVNLHMNVLSGIYIPEEGTIRIKNTDIEK